ncbi:MAG: M36 family metallopeptidase [Bacteroidia bacterium]
MKKAFILILLASSVALTAQNLNKEFRNVIDIAFPQANSNYLISHNHTDKKGITHIYLKQTYNGLEVFNTPASLHVANGIIVNKTGEFYNLSQLSKTLQPQIDMLTAISNAAKDKQMVFNQASFKNAGIENGKNIVVSPETSTEKIFAKQGYLYENGILKPTWQVEIYQDATNDWWCIYIDGINGLKISENSYTSHCSLNEIVTSSSNSFSFIFDDEPKQEIILRKNGTPQYKAWSLPYESPRKGQRKMISNADDNEASPFGWHDTNGVAGPDLFITRGNNVFAKEDTAARNLITGYSSPADANFTFDFFYDENARPSENLNAAITNLFVWNNYIHDIMYLHGFDEASGNFQYKNYTGQGLGNDVVMAEAQDGSGTSNANFSSPVDGTSGRMQMYLWPVGTTSNNFLTVIYPSSLAKAYLSPQTTQFGSRIGSTPITAKLILYKDTNATTSLACVLPSNANELLGNIALIDRGTCNFTNKVLAAQQAGAIAAVVINNQTGNPTAMTGSNSQITIPSVMVSQTDGNAFKAALATDSIVVTLIDPNRNQKIYDSDFDNGVITHEYGHGVSIRLTGGAGNSSCLNNQEQPGEGWSDFFALALTTRKWESKSTARGIGTYLINQDTNGLGIRPYRYSYNMSINPVTYNSIRTLSVPHGVGFVFASVLYDIMWDLIDVYGFDPDFYRGKGGNNIAMQLVIDGLKLQKCQPGFMDCRDAILLADSLNYGFKHKELLWKAFARRGMGFSATQGATTSRTDGNEAFDLPPGLNPVGIAKGNVLNNLVNVYPNPFAGQINIELSKDAYIYNIKVFNTEGKLVNIKQVNKVSRNENINLDNLQAGLYFIEIESSDGKFVSKALKQ